MERGWGSISAKRLFLAGHLSFICSFLLSFQYRCNKGAEYPGHKSLAVIWKFFPLSFFFFSFSSLSHSDIGLLHQKLQKRVFTCLDVWVIFTVGCCRIACENYLTITGQLVFLYLSRLVEKSSFKMSVVSDAILSLVRAAWLSWQPCYFCGWIALSPSPAVRLLSVRQWAIFSSTAFCFSSIPSKPTLNPCWGMRAGVSVQ